MPTYVFKGRNRFNEIVAGERVAPDRAALESALRREQVILTSAKEKGKGFDFQLGKREKVKTKELAIFTRQFSVMLDAGLPLVQCLDILGQQQDNPYFAKVISRTREDVEAGSTLADAMSRHPKVFEQLFVNMVEAGETGGILDIILQRLSTFLEKLVKLKSDVKSALVYPVAVIAISIIVISVIMIFVIPSFKSIFESLVGPGEGLPWLTEMVVQLSSFMASFWWLIAIVLGLAFYGLRTYYKTAKGKKVLDGLSLKIPIIGEILRKIAISRFSRTLGTLLSSGVPILESLDITARTSGNVVVEEAILKVRVAIEQGETFLEPLKQAKIFPPMVCQMIGAGEMTGAIDQMLQKIADFYEEEVDVAVNNLTALMEPLVIVVLGTIIGGLVVSMYLPIFQLGSLLGS